VPRSHGKPKLAVWKFSSCDGCQLSLLDCEEQLLAVADAFEIAYFLEASRAQVRGPYALSLVEGSIATAHDLERIRRVRAQSKVLVTIGACATSGGIQALRNFRNYENVVGVIYAHPEYLESLSTSTGIDRHVAVDFELRGCPVDRGQLIEVLAAALAGRKPVIAGHSVCVECKLAGNVCVAVAGGTACLGPITQAGCGALCPSHDRGCYGCFGPQNTPNAAGLSQRLESLGMGDRRIAELYRSFNADAPAFKAEGDKHER
jgi:coenzyme F420-reducing hydrogenase gamma subunit